MAALAVRARGAELICLIACSDDSDSRIQRTRKYHGSPFESVGPFRAFIQIPTPAELNPMYATIPGWSQEVNAGFPVPFRVITAEKGAIAGSLSQFCPAKPLPESDAWSDTIIDVQPSLARLSTLREFITISRSRLTFEAVAVPFNSSIMSGKKSSTRWKLSRAASSACFQVILFCVPLLTRSRTSSVTSRI